MSFMLRVPNKPFVLYVVMLSVVMLNVTMLNVVMLNVVMLSVVPLRNDPQHNNIHLTDIKHKNKNMTLKKQQKYAE